MRYRIEFVHNRSVFFAFPFGGPRHDPELVSELARGIIRGYFDEAGDRPLAVDPSPSIPDTVHIVDDQDRVLASWSLRQEFIQRRRERAPA